MNILAIGDVVSSIGCEYLRKKLPSLKKMYGVDFCIVNGENSAAGNGITPQSADFLFDSGADLITTGNHVFRRREIYDRLDTDRNIIRPANYYAGNPGKGYAIADMGSVKIGVINLAGNAFMEGANPFTAADEVLKKVDDCRIILCDFHAEATGEKRALGFYLDGRVSAVLGTHTHIPTADGEILPKGTAYITDAGMTGVIDSVLGVEISCASHKVITGLPVHFRNPEGQCKADCVIVETDNKTGRAISIERFSIQ